MSLQDVINIINQFIIANGNNEITANVLRPILLDMIQQPNDLIGDLADLDTTDKTTLVNAINEVLNNSSGVSLLQGTTDPNVTPPPVYTTGDFYIWDDGSLQGFFQFNGTTWVQVTEQVAPTIKQVEIGSVATVGDYTTLTEIVATINALNFTVDYNELILFEGYIVYNGALTFASYWFKQSNIIGIWGTGQANGQISESDLILNYQSNNPDDILAKGIVIDFGSIGFSTLEDYVNATPEPFLDAWLLSSGNIYFFKWTQNTRTDLVALYVGPMDVKLGTTGNHTLLATDYEILSYNGRPYIFGRNRWNDLRVMLKSDGAVSGVVDSDAFKVFYNNGTNIIESFVFNVGFSNYLVAYKSLLDGGSHDIWVNMANQFEQKSLIGKVSSITDLGGGEYRVDVVSDATALAQVSLNVDDFVEVSFNALTSSGAGSTSLFETFVAIAFQTNFVLSDSPANVDVTVNRVAQIPVTDFSLATNTVTLTYQADAGDVVVIRKYY